MYNDMNSRFLKLAYAMTVALLLAACSQNDFSDGQGEPLPEGRYPLQISSVTMSVQSSSEPWNANAPQTRVAENTTDGNSSLWTNGDQIGVKIGTNTETGVYTVNTDGSGNVTSLTPATPLYWKNTTSQTVTAWYPATGGTLSLADQSNSLAYVLAGTGSGDYQSEVSLTFAHALAKVRVKPEGDKADKVTRVEIKSYTSCTHDKGKVSSGASEGWIKMKEVTYNGTKCWEANVVPGYEIKKFKINDAIEGQLTTAVTPQAANVHEVKITVKNPPLGDKTAEQAAVGDFYMNDGSLVGKNASLTPEQQAACIGIVFQIDPSRIGQAEMNVLADIGIATPHGLVMAVKNAASGIHWGPQDTDTGLTNCESWDACQKDISGLGNCQTIRALNNWSNYPAFEAADDYNKTCKAPTKTTGWYLPAAGQLYDMFVNLGKLSTAQPANSNNDYYWTNQVNTVVNSLNSCMTSVTSKDVFELDQRFWSSSEYSNRHARYWNLYSNGNVTCKWNNKNLSASNYPVRAVLAF